MKTKLYVIAIFAFAFYFKSNAQTNKSLSNLTSPTAINQSLLPDKNNSKDLGSDSSAWRNIYLTNRVYLDKKIVLHAPGSGNFFAGSEAGKTSLSGSFNTGAGQYALNNITSGLNNTATGYTALFYNTSGRDNTASGYLSYMLIHPAHIIQQREHGV